jgi:calpain-15
VVAEKQYLIQKLLPHQEFNDTGCYEVNFCLDGQWTSIVVDSLLPVLARTPKILKNAKGTQNQQKPNSRGGVQIADGITVQPAFAAGNVSWPAIIEKAYAKVHGSYSRLSGGFISEALYDLTGAPIERIHFHKEFDYDQLFARLLSFASAGFLMGIATSAGGDGLVASHAYSLLGVYEIHDVVVGEQKKVTNFFNKQEKVDNDVIIVEPPINELKSAVEMRETVRLVCIRNPWGVREWKGTWSASSDQWTEKIRRQLGNDICKQGDGTFFMSFHDMIKRFDHMDVAKCQEVSVCLHDIFFEIELAIISNPNVSPQIGMEKYCARRSHQATQKW